MKTMHEGVKTLLSSPFLDNVLLKDILCILYSNLIAVNVHSQLCDFRCGHCNNK